jgi:hypothetical protein
MVSGLLFIEDLLRTVPELRRVYAGHLADNDEVLPHVFMGDVTRFAVAEAGADRNADVLARMLGQFEKILASGDDEARELVVASFVENLCGEAATVRKLKALMGPHLRARAEAITGV